MFLCERIASRNPVLSLCTVTVFVRSEAKVSRTSSKGQERSSMFLTHQGQAHSLSTSYKPFRAFPAALSTHFYQVVVHHFRHSSLRVATIL